jgi:hypothetical protein
MTHDQGSGLGSKWKEEEWETKYMFGNNKKAAYNQKLLWKQMKQRTAPKDEITRVLQIAKRRK